MRDSSVGDFEALFVTLIGYFHWGQTWTEQFHHFFHLVEL